MSRLLLESSAFVADTFRVLADDEPLPREGDVFVSSERFLTERPDGQSRAGRTGVLLAPTDDALLLAGALDAVEVIAIEFPRYNDGRGYSHARHLREHLGYGGELRALGDVAADEVYMLRRCGFDVFALRAGEDSARAIAALERYSVVMQSAPWSPAQRLRAAQ